MVFFFSVGICAGVTAFFAYPNAFRSESQIIQQHDLEQSEVIAKKLDLPTTVAAKVTRGITAATKRPPEYSYSVSASDAQEAARIVQKKVDAGTEKLPEGDRTVITPQPQKVDVYRINLDKPMGIGVYISTESTGAMGQYKNTVIFGGPRFRGGYEIGVGYMARF